MHKVKYKSKYNKFVDNCLSAFGKLGSNKQLSSLRDGFAMITPLMIVGALGVVFIVFIFGGWGSHNASFLGLIARALTIGKTPDATGIYQSVGVQINDGMLTFLDGSNFARISQIGEKIFGALWDATIGGALSLYTAFSIGYFYSRVRSSSQPAIAGLISLASFFILTGFDAQLFGPKGSLVSILTAFVSMEIYCRLEKSKKLFLKMPSGVPPAVATSFSKLFPAMILLAGLTLTNVPFVVLNILYGTSSASLGSAIYTGLQAPFETLAANPNGQLGIGLLFIILVGFFWFFGLHGSNILDGAVNPIWFVLLAMNTNALQNGEMPTQAIAKGFWDSYVYIGGTGATLALLVGTLMFSRRKDTREISKFSIPAGIFQINEPVTFGYPMVLNVNFFIPYVLLMPILTIISWLAISILHWVPGGIVPIPWSTPMILGGFLHTGSWKGALLAIFNFVFAILFYLPFIFAYNRKAKKEGIEATISWSDKIVNYSKRYEISKDILSCNTKLDSLKHQLSELKNNYDLSENQKLKKKEEIQAKIHKLQGEISGFKKENIEFVTNVKEQIKLAKEKIDKSALKQEISNLKMLYRTKFAESDAKFDKEISKMNSYIISGYHCAPEELVQIKAELINLKLKYNQDLQEIKNDYRNVQTSADSKLKNKKIKYDYQEKINTLDTEYLENINNLKADKYIDGPKYEQMQFEIEEILAKKDAAFLKLKTELNNKISELKKSKEVNLRLWKAKLKNFKDVGIRE